jgi:serine/threonine protein kinase
MANKMLEKNIMTTKPKFPGFVSKQAVDLIQACLQKNPKNRPSCRQALTHVFFSMNGCIFDEPLPAHCKTFTHF